MKNFGFLFLIIISITSCQTPSKMNNDLSELQLKGKVKSIKEKTYEVVMKNGNIAKGKLIGAYTNTTFNKKGNIVIESTYNNVDELLKLDSLTYNVDGYSIIKKSYDSNDFLYMKINEKLNRKGQLIETIEKNFYVNESPRKWVYDYDENGKLKETNSFEVTESNEVFICKWVYKNDTKNNFVEEIRYNKDGFYEWKQTSKYDSADNLIEESNYDSGNNLTSRIIRKYDEKRNLIKSQIFHGIDVLYNKTSFSYDDFNNLTTINEYDSSEVLKTHTTYEYTYDQSNNWIKRIGTENDSFSTIKEREIEYY